MENKILLGDCIELMQNIRDNSVDLVLTDPPYGKEYLYLWEELSKGAKRVLKENGYCIAYSGKMFLPEVLAGISKHLRYKWCISLLHKQSNIAWGVRYFDEWRPIIVLQNNDKNDSIKKVRHDVIYPSGSDKRFHIWGQAVGDAIDLILDYSNENDLVLDPFVGGGTIPIACIKANRKYIGIEINEEYCRIASKRIEQELAQLKLEL